MISFHTNDSHKRHDTLLLLLLLLLCEQTFFVVINQLNKFKARFITTARKPKLL